MKQKPVITLWVVTSSWRPPMWCETRAQANDANRKYLNEQGKVSEVTLTVESSKHICGACGHKLKDSK